MAEKIKRSKKSVMKKRPQDWDDLKIEIAKEMGIWHKVENDGWSALSAVESGRLGGIFSRRKKNLYDNDREDN
ncbi:MAG: small, acid-soluble spore protein, alpha/beta type [Bacillota bacterium]|jgi:hypothetical protein